MHGCGWVGVIQFKRNEERNALRNISDLLSFSSDYMISMCVSVCLFAYTCSLNDRNLNIAVPAPVPVEIYSMKLLAQRGTGRCSSPLTSLMVPKQEITYIHSEPT